MRPKTAYTFRGVSKEGIRTVIIKDRSTLICNNNRTKRDCIRISIQITGNIPIIFVCANFNQFNLFHYYSNLEEEERLKMSEGVGYIGQLPDHHNKTKRLKHEYQNNSNISD
jgi:hypothetical protein